MKKMEGKIKMASLITMLAIAFLVIATVACESQNVTSITELNATTLEILEATTEAVTETAITFSESRVTKNTSKKLETLKNGRHDPKWADRGPKPLFYGKKFELQKDLNVNRHNSKEDEIQDGLVSPLITTPIRTLPLILEANRLSKNQNDILDSVRDSLRENFDGVFNKTYFQEDVTTENNDSETMTENGFYQNDNSEEEEDSNSNSRLNADRSLMVVLPFNAEDDKNVEELYTKKPFVKMIDTSSNFNLHVEEEKDFTTPRTTGNPTEQKRKNFFTERPWKPSTRLGTTSRDYATSTEYDEDITKTYTNYNDVEQVTKKFENSEATPASVGNHKHNAEIITLSPIKSFRKKTSASVEEDKKSTTPLTSLDFVEVEDEKPVSNIKLKRKNQRKKIKTTSTQGPPKPEDLTKVLDILPTNMKEIIYELGLNKESKEKKENNPEEKNVFEAKKVFQPTIDPKSYAVFKPLPLEIKEKNENYISEDMKSFLASFGLYPAGRRTEKFLKPDSSKREEEISEATLNFLPHDLKLVLHDMGLLKYNKKDSPTIHVFNPSNYSVGQSDEDSKKLNAILSFIKATMNESESITPEMHTEIIQKIKELDNMQYKSENITEINNEIKKIILNKLPKESKSRTNKRASKLFEGPDPLTMSDESPSKNDVKRQEKTNGSSDLPSGTVSSNASSSSSFSSASASSASSASSSSSSASSSASASSPDASLFSTNETVTPDDLNQTTTTTEENPSLVGLRDSFGGGETASDGADVDSSLPPKRPNGLYFLFDWNSFFEVGTEDDDRRVNLRFQPKIGDSRNFLPVSVP